MSLDVVDLRNFYAHRLGAVARDFIGRGIRKRWSNTAGQRVLGLGYASPYLGQFREKAERCLAFMPAAQGVVKWPSARPSLTSLVEELDLPLSDAAVDHGIGAVHRAVGALIDTLDLPAGINGEVAGAVFLAVLGRMTEPTAAPLPDSDERAAELMVNLLRRSLLRTS